MNKKFQPRISGVLLAIAALAAAWLILSRPWFYQGKSVPWDSKDEFYPALRFVVHSLRLGRIPGWNPYVYGGYPIISDPQAMIFSPLAVFLMSAVSEPSIHWFDGIELIHILIGGIGILLLSVRLGRSAIAALFAALIYMYGGPASGRMEHVPMILTYAYFPLAMLALDHALQSKRRSSAATFGVLAGVMAAQQNQVAYLFSLVLIGYALFLSWSSGSIRRYVWERWQIFAVAATAGMATLAIPLYLSIQFLPLSNRIQIPYAAAAAWSIHPLTFMSLFIRNFFGNARMNTYWGFSDIVETYLFAGTLPIVLIVRYGIANGLLLDRQVRFFLWAGIAGILYSVGRFTPFFWLAYHVIPGVDLYRRPSDATFVVNMALAVVSGFLIDKIITRQTEKVRPAILFLAGIPLLGFFTWAFVYASQQGKLGFLKRESMITVLFVAVSLWLLRAMKNAVSNQAQFRFATVAVILFVADMGVHSVGSDLNAVSYAFPVLMNDAAVKNPAAHFLHEVLSAESGHDFYRADITAAGTLWGNAPMLLDIQSSQGYNPLRYRLYDRVAGAQDNSGVIRPFTPLLPSYDSPLFNLLGVKYIVSGKELSEIDPKVEADRFGLVFNQDGTRIWENPNSLPRVMAVTSLYIEPELESAIDTGRLANVDFRSTAVLTHTPRTLQTRNGGMRSGSAVARIVEYSDNQVAIAVQSDGDAIVILNDPYYPYWKAYVDGQERELLQANYLFRGVHVKSGEREVVFRFEPFSWSAIKGTLRSGVGRH